MLIRGPTKEPSNIDLLMYGASPNSHFNFSLVDLSKGVFVCSA
jgi:hypothetical protein